MGTYIKQNWQDFYFINLCELWYSYILDFFVCIFTIFKKYVMNVVWVPIYATSLQYISLLHAFLSMKDGHFITIGLFLLGDIFFILKLAPCLASLVSEF